MDILRIILLFISVNVSRFQALEFNSIQEYLNSFKKIEERDSNIDATTTTITPTESVPIFKHSPLLSMFPGSPPHQEFNSSVVGDPLILTPFIENGNCEQARNLSKVDSEFSDIKSYTGFFTVNKKYNSNLFFWYVPAQVKIGKQSFYMNSNRY